MRRRRSRDANVSASLLTRDPAACGYRKKEGTRAAALREASAHEDTWTTQKPQKLKVPFLEPPKHPVRGSIRCHPPWLILPRFDVHLPELDVSVVAGRGQHGAVWRQGAFADPLPRWTEQNLKPKTEHNILSVSLECPRSEISPSQRRTHFSRVSMST